MIAVRKAEERFHTKIGWLDSWHTFSFGEHYHPELMGFRSLRVINDDRVREGQGFGTHGHRDMEIISYVLEGELGHKDSLGTGSVIRPGEVQRMSAGTGVRHSEMNPSPDTPVHFLQIWIEPEQEGLEPSYEQKAFPVEERRGKLRLIAGKGGKDGAVTIHQDAQLYGTLLAQGERVEYVPPKERYTWIHVARGEIEVNGTVLRAGDGLAAAQEPSLSITGKGAGEADVLVFDLA